MINEEVSNKAVNLEIRLAKLTAKGILKLINRLLVKAKRAGMSLDTYLKIWEVK